MQKSKGLFSRSTSQNFLRAMIILADYSLCSLKEFLNIVLGEDVPITIDEIEGGFYMIVKIALAEYDIFEFLSV